MFGSFVGRNGTRLYHYVGGVGAGLLRLFVGGINLGERAPTSNRFEMLPAKQFVLANCYDPQLGCLLFDD
jgi:hypothetical protein